MGPTKIQLRLRHQKCLQSIVDSNNHKQSSINNPFCSTPCSSALGLPELDNPAMSSTQPLPSPTEAQPQNSKNTIPMLVPVFIIFFLFMCFLSIFIFRDILRYLSAWLRTRAVRRSTNNNDGRPQQGLDPKIISSFPTLPYSALHKLRNGNCDCECPICLSEFNMDDVMKLLTVCCHAFHPECIDSWLASHTTCPICRSDLEKPPTALATATAQEVVEGGCDNSHVIVIDDGESL